jgi:hypothetical protein
MASGLGRGLRVIVGLVLIYLGLASMGGTGGWVVAIVGLVVFLAGALNFCLFGPLFGAPFSGKGLDKAV